MSSVIPTFHKAVSSNIEHRRHHTQHLCSKAMVILPVASDIPPLPDAVKSVFTDIRQEWNAPSVVEFGPWSRSSRGEYRRARWGGGGGREVAPGWCTGGGGGGVINVDATPPPPIVLLGHRISPYNHEYGVVALTYHCAERWNNDCLVPPWSVLSIYHVVCAIMQNACL